MNGVAALRRDIEQQFRVDLDELEREVRWATALMLDAVYATPAHFTSSVEELWDEVFQVNYEWVFPDRSYAHKHYSVAYPHPMDETMENELHFRLCVRGQLAVGTVVLTSSEQETLSPCSHCEDGDRYDHNRDEYVRRLPRH